MVARAVAACAATTRARASTGEPPCDSSSASSDIVGAGSPMCAKATQVCATAIATAALISPRACRFDARGERAERSRCGACDRGGRELTGGVAPRRRFLRGGRDTASCRNARRPRERTRRATTRRCRGASARGRALRAAAPHSMPSSAHSTAPSRSLPPTPRIGRAQVPAHGARRLAAAARSGSARTRASVSPARSSHEPGDAVTDGAVLRRERRVGGLAHERVAEDVLALAREAALGAAADHLALAERRRASSRTRGASDESTSAATPPPQKTSPKTLAARRTWRASASSASRRDWTIASTVSGSASPWPLATERMSSSR